MSSISLRLPDYKYNEIKSNTNTNNKKLKNKRDLNYNNDISFIIFNTYDLSHLDLEIFNILYFNYKIDNDEKKKDIENKMNDNTKFIDIIIYMFSKCKELNFLLKKKINDYIKKYPYINDDIVIDDIDNINKKKFKSSDELFKEQRFKHYKLTKNIDFNILGKNTILKKKKKFNKSKKKSLSSSLSDIDINNDKKNIEMINYTNKELLVSDSEEDLSSDEEDISNLLIKLDNNENISEEKKDVLNITKEDDEYTEIKL